MDYNPSHEKSDLKVLWSIIISLSTSLGDVSN